MSIRVAAGLVLAVGVIFQFVQTTDPVFPLAYFTVDSAILFAFVALIGLCRREEGQWIGAARGAFTMGVLFSGLIYALLIAPTSPSGTWFEQTDDLWVQAATVMLHAVGPVLVVADFLGRPAPGRDGWGSALLWTAWPVAYIAVMSPLQLAGVTSIPYEFLQPAEGGSVPAAVAVVVLAVVFTCLGRALQQLVQQRIRARTGKTASS